MTEAAALPEELASAIVQLHREKDLAYRDAWKRRGELIGVVANIARKVDRLENLLAGGPATRDESLFDTAADLYVYSLKYLTYLADQDEEMAQELFGAGLAALRPPYSDGPHAVEYLVREETPPASRSAPASLAEAGRDAVRAFGDLEECFTGPGATSVRDRATRASRLTEAAVAVLVVASAEVAASYRDFLASYGAVDRPGGQSA